MKTRTFKFTFAQFSLWAALLLFGSSAFGQRINPATRIQKAPAPDYILLSDSESEYRHARLDTTIAGGSVTVDTFRYSNDTLYISLSGDGEPQKWVVITGAAIDDQVVDTFTIVNDTLLISIENDGEPALAVSLKPYLDDTDQQTVDTFSLAGTVLTLALERDGEAPYTVDLAGIDTDNQTVDTLSLAGGILTLALEGDGEAPYTVDLSSLSDGTGTDDQVLFLAGSSLSIEDGNSVDLSPLLDNTDNQTVDSFFISNDTLYLALERDGEAPYFVIIPPGIDSLNDLLNVDATPTTGQVLQWNGTIWTAGTVTSGGDADSDPGNEIQTITYNPATDEITLSIGGGTIDISEVDTDTDRQTVDTFSLAGTVLTLALERDGEAPYQVDLSSLDTDTDDQTVDTFAIVANTLSIALEGDGEPPYTVDLSPYLDNTDGQTLSLDGSTLSITGGNSVDLSSLGGGTDDQTVDTFSLSGTILTLALEGDNEPPYTVDLASLAGGAADGNGIFDANNDGGFVPGDFQAEVDTVLQFADTDASSSGLSVEINNVDGKFELEKLADAGQGFLSRFDAANNIFYVGVLNPPSGNTLPLLTVSKGVSAGNDIINLQATNVQVSYDSNNRYLLPQQGPTTSAADTSFAIWPGTASLPQPGSFMTLAQLRSTISAGIDTDNQTVDTFAIVSNTLTLALEDDGEAPYSVDLSPYLDNTDGQTLSLVTNTLSITGGNSVDLSGYLDNTDGQTLGLVGTTLSITGGNSVDLAGIDTDTDNQTVDTFAIVSNTLTLALEDDGEAPYSVDLSPYLDNTDSQTLGLVGTTLSITGGNSVDLAGIDTDTDNQTVDTFAIVSNTLTLALEDDGEAPYSVDLSPYLDNTDGQTLSYSGGGSLSITGGNSVDLSDLLDNTDSQTLSLVTNTLSITGGNSVSLAAYLDNTDSQTLGLVGTALSITGGNSVDLAGIDTDTDNQTVDTFALSGTVLTLALEGDGEAPYTVDLASLVGGSFSVDLNLLRDTLTRPAHGFNQADVPIPVGITKAPSASLFAATASTAETTHSAFIIEVLDVNTVVVATEGIFATDTYHGYLPGRDYFLTGTALVYDTLAPASLHNDWIWTALDSFRLALRATRPYDPNEVLTGGEDNQTVDTFALSGTVLTLALENDGESPYTVDLSEGIQDEVGALIAAGGGIGISYDDGGNTLTISNTGDTNASDDLTTSTTFSGDVSGTYSATVVADDSHNHSASTISTNILSSLDGVINDGGNIDLLASGIVSITPDDGENTITISATEVDGSTTNEIQDLGWTQSTGVLTITSGTSATILPMTGATGVAAGEQGLVPQPAAGQEGLFLRGDGTWASASGSGDNWGSQVVQVTARLSGNGTAGSPLDLAQQSAGSGQVLKWNGSAWAPGDDTDTDDQTLSLVTNTLSISEGNSVSLAAYLDNTDAQTLSLAGTTLSITGGNSQDLEYFDPDAMDSQTSGTVNLGSEKQYARIIDMTGLSSITVTLNNPLDGGAYIILFTNADDTDTVTWPASVKYENNTAPGTGILSDGRRMVQLLYDGSTFWVPGGYN